ncbi:Zinc finger C6HC type [Echinococcus multilocularis]|uniref:RBR-type E3 ubiquitin transferase n=1 Tax=Echinococcus multilocularis TaxID=6211 RepID=A0A087VXH3_ECHMU|nr:Zinc finger C6HC type [Echinococcus multilocularis]
MDDSFVELMSHSDSEEFSDDIDTEFYRAVDGEDALEYQNPEFIPLTPDMLIQYMLELVNAVHQVTTLPKTIIRLLLDHFKWDKDALIEQYFEHSNPRHFVKSTILPSLVDNNDDIPSLFLLPYTDVHGGGGEKVNCSPEMICDICCAQTSSDEMLGLGCGHFYCRTCWLGYLQSKILDESQANRLTCPAFKCDGLIDDDSVSALLLSLPKTSVGETAVPESPKPSLPLAYRRFQRLVVNSFVQHNRYLTWCPGVDCGHAVRAIGTGVGCGRGNGRVMREVVCSNCEETFCFACGNPWHEPTLCKYLKLWLSKMKNDSGTAHWVAANTKECPNCKATIEKNGGCNHMTCRSADCKYEFCWVCLGSWDLHGSQWYVCNSYKEAAAQRAREAQDASRASLSRYLFYHDRYANHEQSRRMEATLKDSVASRMMELERQGMSWIDVKFVRHVVEVLCACRRTLMYTYVFAYFLEPSNHALIFEANQSDLEQATEQLSRFLEWDLNSTMLVGGLKQKLQDKSRYCEQRRRVLLQHVAEGYERNIWRHRDYP